MYRPRRGYGLKNGSQRGRRLGGRRMNRSTICRHPKIRRRRF